MNVKPVSQSIEHWTFKSPLPKEIQGSCDPASPRTLGGNFATSKDIVYNIMGDT